MSLNNMSLGTLVGKQYLFKWKAFAGVFNSMIALQLLAIVFTWGGTGQHGTSMGNVSISMNFYSTDGAIGLTLVWAFFSSILITTKSYRNDDYLFITNRLSSNLANMAFLLAASVVAGLTAICSQYLIQMIQYVRGNTLLTEALPLTLGEWVSGAVATILYVLFIAAIGYLIGCVVQLHRTLVVIIPVALIGFLFIYDFDEPGFISLFEFYFQENNFWLFSVKILATVLLLFAASILVSNRQEVRK
ncbi:hypothetical protein [Oceanobacillus picturae]|uniref:hypothetical protein n=1 Tax=Oceanobacillus picturae TaxID=171693 RepID=UPI000E688D24|nr:hypothetical protein [Oceanobacillus picturae]RIU91955.1 hypothetical protein D1864_10040 [Oceanobacillus picturae]